MELFFLLWICRIQVVRYLTSMTTRIAIMAVYQFPVWFIYWKVPCPGTFNRNRQYWVRNDDKMKMPFRYDPDTLSIPGALHYVNHMVNFHNTLMCSRMWVLINQLIIHTPIHSSSFFSRVDYINTNKVSLWCESHCKEYRETVAS